MARYTGEDPNLKSPGLDSGHRDSALGRLHLLVGPSAGQFLTWKC